MTNPATTLLSELVELIPLALVIALSPLSIIPGILVLHTPRPRPTSLAFLAGWTLAIATVTAAFVGGSEMSTGLSQAPPWARYVRIVLGVALIAWGLYRWVKRNNSAHTPKWLTSMTSIGPGRAFLTGIVLTLANMKVLLMCIAAGVAIGTAALGRTQSWTAVAIFTALAASSVALPTLAYLVAGERLDEPLTRLKKWMEDNHAGLIGAVLILIGVVVLYKGIHAG